MFKNTTSFVNEDKPLVGEEDAVYPQHRQVHLLGRRHSDCRRSCPAGVLLEHRLPQRNYLWHSLIDLCRSCLYKKIDG
jgi:hypothetical protein